MSATSRAARLAELADLAETAAARERIVRAQPVIEAVVEATDRSPGLYADESGDLEARWIIRPDRARPARIVSVTFSLTTASAYTYSRTSGSVLTEISVPVDDPRVAKLITILIENAVDGQPLEQPTP